MIYERLNPAFKAHVDRLTSHVATLLWPERRVAFESFHSGIAKCNTAEISASLKALGVEPPKGKDDADRLFRVLLTACLERLDEPTVTNPDQAALYVQSLAERDAARAIDWLARHPEHRARVGGQPDRPK